MSSLKVTLRLGLAVAVGIAALATPTTAQQPPVPLSVKQLKPDVYWTQGGAGSNTGIIIGKTGVIVIDAGTTADSAKERLAEIAKLTPKPVTHVILTHSDGDHVNGVAAFPAGVTVVAHDGNKKELDAALAAGGRGAPPADRLPSQVVTKNKDTVTIDGVKLELLHWAPAHTSGDLVVYLPDQKIVFAGDITTGAAYIIQTNRPSPLIHANKMGSSEGWITTVKGMLALNADQYVPGHGDVQTKADIQTVLKATEEKRAKIAAMVKDGKSLDEIRVVTGDVPRPAAGAGRGPAFASFTDVVYQELTKKRG